MEELSKPGTSGVIRKLPTNGKPTPSLEKPTPSLGKPTASLGKPTPTNEIVIEPKDMALLANIKPSSSMKQTSTPKKPPKLENVSDIASVLYIGLRRATNSCGVRTGVSGWL